ncbi:ATP-grasp domain-containing protein [Candidatus Pelagibacter sp.]|nr:ATP-grasp domain-containing protein [Candidatus Pelagibacter sp.]
MNNFKWIVFFPAGKEQTNSIKIAKKYKFKTIGIDRDKNAEGKKYVNKFFLTKKVIPKINFIDKLKKENFSNIFSISSDVGLNYIKYIKDKFRIDHNFKDYDLIVNKYKIRKKINKFKLNPIFRYCKNEKELKKFIKKKKIGTYVTKPIYGSASKNVSILANHEDLPKKIKKGFLVEKFINGSEYTVDGIKIKNKIIYALFTKKERSIYNKAVARSVSTINKNSKILKKIKRSTAKILNELGVITSPFHLEFINHKNKIFLIDFAARSGGSNIGSKLAQKHSGYNISKAFIDNELFSNSNERIKKNKKLKMIWLFNFEKNLKDAMNNEKKYKKIKNLKLITDKTRDRQIIK